MKVLLDIDGVVADFVGGACRLHGVPDPYLKPENHGHYEIQDLVGIHGPAFWDPMGEEFWANLEPTTHMQEIVTLLTLQYGVKNICLLTSPVRTPGCIDGKMRWIRRHLPDFSRRFLVGPAKEFCAHENSILFDDSESNVRKFEAAGGRTFLVPGLWNSLHKLDALGAIQRFLG